MVPSGTILFINHGLVMRNEQAAIMVDDPIAVTPRTITIIDDVLDLFHVSAIIIAMMMTIIIDDPPMIDMIDDVVMMIAVVTTIMVGIIIMMKGWIDYYCQQTFQ